MKRYLLVAWLLLASFGALAQQQTVTLGTPADTQTYNTLAPGSAAINADITQLFAGMRAPAAAAAAGMNTLTYGPAVTLGQNWFLFNLAGVTPIPGQAVQNADGSVTLPGADGSGYGANIATAHLVGGNLKGTAFSGGYYIEFVVKFTPTLGSSSLPFPALWSLDTNFLTANYLQWPGQATGFYDRIEQDFFQWPHNSLQYWDGVGTIDWFGYYNSNADLSGVAITGTGGQISFTSHPNTHAGDFVTIVGTLGGTGTITGYSTGTAYQIAASPTSTTATLLSAAGSAITTSAGTLTGLNYMYGNVTQPAPNKGAEILMGPNGNPFSFANYNRYGFLVTPATASTQGSILNYLNGVQVNYAAGAPNVVWNLYSTGNAPPPVATTTAASLLDTLKMVLIIGTDATCPMTIQSVAVWQASASGNLVQ